MTRHHLLSRFPLHQRLPQIASAIAILVGCLVLLGWSLDVSFLKSIIPGAATMKANVALGFILAGVSLGLNVREGGERGRGGEGERGRNARKSRFYRAIAGGCNVAVLALGLLTLSEYLFGWNLGIERLLFPNFPGRMADNSALNFALVGLALELNGKKTRRWDAVAQSATLCAAAIALLVLVGYVYQVEVFYRFVFYSTSMAIHTALTFVVLCVGILSLQADRGFMQVVTSKNIGSVTARQLMPVAIAIPFLLGWLILQGMRAHLYNGAFALALLVVALVATLVLVIWKNARWLNRLDYDRNRSSDRLRSSEERLQLALQGAGQGIWDWDLKRQVLTWDDRCQEIFGLPPDVPVTYEWHLNALHPDDRQRVARAGKIALRDRTKFDEEYRTVRPDGTIVWVLARGRGYYDAAGQPYRMSGTVLDISDRKLSEAALQESEKRYRFMVENTSDMVFHIGLHQPLPLALPMEQAVDWIFREAFVVAVNDGFLRSYGYDRADQLVGRPLTDVVPRTPKNEAMERALVANGHRIVEAQTEEVDRHGGRKVMLNSIVGRIAGGCVYDYIGTSRDITDRVLAEEALAAQEQRYRYIFQSVGVAIWEEDFSEVKAAIDRLKDSGVEDFRQYFAQHPEFVQWAIGAVRILDVNEVAIQIAGARNKSQLLTSLHEIFLPETIPTFIDELLAIAAGETFFQSEVVVRNLQGQRLYVLFTITFPPPTAPYDRVLVTWSDISDRKQAQLNDRFLNDLDLQLRQLSDPEAMEWEVVSSLGEYLKVDRATWLEIDRDNRLAIIDRDWRREGLSSHAGTYAIAEAISPELQIAHAAGKTIAIVDIATDPRSAPYVDAYRQLNIGAMVAVPCIRAGRWVAALNVNTKNPRLWRDDEIALLQETVARLWSIIEQTRALQALRASEEQFRGTFDNAAVGIAHVGLDGSWLRVNDKLCQILGYPRNELLARTFQNITYPEDLDADLELVQRTLAGEIETYSIEKRYIRQDGAIVWINLTVSLMRKSTGEPNYFISVIEDISERKQTEADLQERSEHIRLLYETTSDLLSTDCPLALVEALFGKLKPLIGLDVYFNYLLDDRQQQLHLMFYGGISNDTARNMKWLEVGQAICGTVAQQRCQIVQPDLQRSTDPKAQLVKSLGLTAYACQPLIAQSKFFGTLGFGSRTRSDFTPAETKLFQVLCDQIAIALERAELLSSLQQQTEELRRANRLKDEFLTALSHELRTPLNPIQGWTQMLQRGRLNPAKTAEALAAIERNVKQQIALVDDLLDISRVVQGQFKLVPEPVDLTPILKAAIETVEFSALAKNIALEFHIPCHSIGKVMGDETRLQQVFWNLLSNAIKFTPDSGRVDVWLERVEGERERGRGGEGERENILNSELRIPNSELRTAYAQVRVMDTGIGISAEFLPHVFDRFRQADGSTTRKYGGLGLGLALVKYLVELHGGTVTAESAGEGRGATFTVNLPLLTETAAPALQAETPTNLPLPPDNLTGIRVLLVDDEPDNLALMEFVLTDAGAIVTPASTAAEALAIASTNSFDAIVSDIGMPGMDGYELMRQIGALPSEQSRSTPAIALTGFARPEDEKQAIAAGFQAYLSKPVNLVDLIAAIAKLVR